MNAQTQYYLGLDIGGTNVDALLVDQENVIHGTVSWPIRDASIGKSIDVIYHVIDNVLQQADITSAQIKSIGMGIPGQVSPLTGDVTLAVNLDTPTLPLKKLLHERYQRPIFIENDANAVTLGTYYFQSESSVKNMAFVTLGTGVGSGLILNGDLYRGAHGMAGEIGHIIVQADSNFRCNCGNYGCLETFVAGPAIKRMAESARLQESDTLLAESPELSAQAVYSAADQGDPLANKIINKVGYYLSMALQSLIMSLDVEEIYIGGGISRAGDTLLKPILKEWAQLRASSSMSAALLHDDMLKLIPPDYRAGAWGAVAVAKHMLNLKQIDTEKPHHLLALPTLTDDAAHATG